MFKAITKTGKRFIENVCSGNGNSLLSGNNGPMPYSDDGNGNPINITWVAEPKNSNGVVITRNSDLAQPLIDWFNEYAKLYDLDANILAAQAYVESEYRIWYYSNKNTASGINQFTMKIIYGVIINNFSDVRPLMWTSGDGIDSNFLKITEGLTAELSASSYEPTKGSSETKLIARENRSILHQNVINNPDVMIQAQARYMKYFANNSNNLASTSLFCYNRGSAFLSSTYSGAIKKLKNKKGIKDDNDPYLKEGLDYVLKVFGVLGDENNQLRIAGLDKKYKPSGQYFGYNDLFNTKTVNSDALINTNGNTSTVDLLTYPNENFSPYDANVSESDEYSINVDNLDNLTISNDPNYRFIYFPEDQYIKEEKIKSQIVLHHTVSGDKTDVSGDIKWWASKDERIATSFIISRQGGIYQLFNTNYWAHHLGIKSNFIRKQGTDKSNIFLNQHSIGIEIDSWGGLVRANNGNWYPTIMFPDGDIQSREPRPNSEYVPIENVQQYNKNNGYPVGFRGFLGFEKYTKEQIIAVEKLIISLNNKYSGIVLNYNEDTWDLTNKETGCDGVSKNALNGKPGIWTHVSYRNDKSDCHPQPELISMLQRLSEGKPNKQFIVHFKNNEKGN